MDIYYFLLKDLLMRKAEEYLGTLESAQDWERFYDNAGGIESQLKVYNIIPIENPLKLKTPVVTHTRFVHLMSILTYSLI